MLSSPLTSSDNIIARIRSAYSALLQRNRSVRTARQYSKTDGCSVSLLQIANTARPVRLRTRTLTPLACNEQRGQLLRRTSAPLSHVPRNNQPNQVYLRGTQRLTEGLYSTFVMYCVKKEDMRLSKSDYQSKEEREAVGSLGKDITT